MTVLNFRYKETRFLYNDLSFFFFKSGSTVLKCLTFPNSLFKSGSRDTVFFTMITRIPGGLTANCLEREYNLAVYNDGSALPLQETLP